MTFLLDLTIICVLVLYSLTLPKLLTRSIIIFSWTNYIPLVLTGPPFSGSTATFITVNKVFSLKAVLQISHPQREVCHKVPRLGLCYFLFSSMTSLLPALTVISNCMPMTLLFTAPTLTSLKFIIVSSTTLTKFSIGCDPTNSFSIKLNPTLCYFTNQVDLKFLISNLKLMDLSPLVAVEQFKYLLVFLFGKKKISQLLLPILDYSDIIYKNTTATSLQPLNVVYNSLCRFILRGPFRTHHCLMYHQLSWLTLSSRCHLGSCIFSNAFISVILTT